MRYPGINVILFACVYQTLLVSCHPDPGPPERMIEVIESLAHEYAPDKRTAIFSVEADLQDGILHLRGELMDPEAYQRLLDSAETLGFEVVDSIVVLPDAELGKLTQGIVRLSVCNIRSAPQHSAELVTQELMGHIVKVYKKKGDWFFVQTPDMYLGWVDESGITLVSEEEAHAWSTHANLLFTQPFGFIRAGASQSSNMICDVVAGALLKRGEQPFINTFTPVELPDGRSGYVPSDQLTLTGSLPPAGEVSGSRIINDGIAFMGIPYIWGGTSAKGFDCSGFTKTVFDLNGIQLPRDASQQVWLGKEISRNLDFDQFCPGDLLFFGRRTDTGEKVTHVAMYAGEGKILHAAGEVRMQSLIPGEPDYAPDRKETFLLAKRILGEKACE